MSNKALAADEWHYTLQETCFFVDTPKKIKGGIPSWSSSKTHSESEERRMYLSFSGKVYSVAKMEYIARGASMAPTSYTAAFLVDKRRIRGIDYTAVKNRRFYDEENVKDPGWHENVLYFDDNAGGIINDHQFETLEGFSTSDLQDFFVKTCAHWNIELPEEERSLL